MSSPVKLKISPEGKLLIVTDYRGYKPFFDPQRGVLKPIQEHINNVPNPIQEPPKKTLPPGKTESLLRQIPPEPQPVSTENNPKLISHTPNKQESLLTPRTVVDYSKCFLYDPQRNLLKPIHEPMNNVPNPIQEPPGKTESLLRQIPPEPQPVSTENNPKLISHTPKKQESLLKPRLVVDYSKCFLHDPQRSILKPIHDRMNNVPNPIQEPPKKTTPPGKTEPLSIQIPLESTSPPRKIEKKQPKQYPPPKSIGELLASGAVTSIQPMNAAHYPKHISHAPKQQESLSQLRPGVDHTKCFLFDPQRSLLMPTHERMNNVPNPIQEPPKKTSPPGKTESLSSQIALEQQRMNIEHNSKHIALTSKKEESPLKPPPEVDYSKIMTLEEIEEELRNPVQDEMIMSTPIGEDTLALVAADCTFPIYSDELLRIVDLL
ncbi:proline-rich extensin-like protein EPR1 isoform X2 [Drosophila elegans]|uniref:proline-rich extensin-like protein EPR1 isoform X2 n=1 Tax=Drosophila elegans TaxID=30023 RepID=UPI001BC8491D|nr:proline-rich extensin-like protein EPR1 isoform X2 [Drosophila elegans]